MATLNISAIEHSGDVQEGKVFSLIELTMFEFVSITLSSQRHIDYAHEMAGCKVLLISYAQRLVLLGN